MRRPTPHASLPPILLVLLVLLASVLTACGPSIPSTPASGTINGKAFAFGSGSVESATGGGFKFTLFDNTGGCKRGYADSKLMVFFILPARTTADYDLSTAQTVTLYDSDGNKNIFCASGRIEITEATDTKISGGLTAEGGSQRSSVAGTFSAEVCK